MQILGIWRLVERIFLVTVFLAMVVLFFFSVVVREIGGNLASDFAWIEEAVRFMNLFLVFCALGLALERGRHVGINTLRDRFPDRVRKWVLKFIDLIGFCFSVYLLTLAFRMVELVFATEQRSPTLDIPMGWIYVAPLAGFGLLAMRFALSFFGVIDRFTVAQAETG
ncbi:MAG: TRAP transporter small permease [Fimbriimonadaceae bacterium]|nr:TRAP transporter small permease [Alphaproteobacteria bacterium]